MTIWSRLVRTGDIDREKDVFMRTNIFATAAGTRYDELRDAMKEYGAHSLAYSTLQPDMKYHSCPSGYLAYRVLHDGQTVAVLGDPVCALHDVEECLVGFLDIHPHAIFLQITLSTAAVLQKLRQYVNIFGKECWLDLNPPSYSRAEVFSLEGSKRERLRTSRNRCRREGIRVEERRLSEVDPAILVDISREWLSTKLVGSELQFLARPLGGKPITQKSTSEGEDFALHEEDGVRLFVARTRANDVIGFVLFDPIYRYGQVEGYVTSILRCRRSYPDNASRNTPRRIPSGLVDAIILEAIDQFRIEGVQSISLGLMPFAPVESNGTRKLRANRLTSILFETLYRFGGSLFNFRSLAWHKRRYFGREEPVYFAAPQKVAQLWHLHQTNRMMGVRYSEALRNALVGRS